MKKLFSLSLFIVVILSACEGDKLNQPEDNGLITATIENLSTRSEYTSKDGLNWATGDVISVYTSGDRFAEYTIQDGVGTKSATFLGLLREGESRNKVAVAPSILEPSIEGSNLVVNIPTKIDGSEEIVSLPVMASAITKYSDLTFKHLSGYVHIAFVLPSGINAISLTAHQKISGSFNTVIDDAEIRVVSGSENCISLDFPAVNQGARKEILLPLPTGDYAEGEITFDLYCAEQKIASVSNPKPLSVTRAIVIDLGTYSVDTFGTVVPVDVPSAKKVETLIGVDKAEVIVTLPDEDVPQCLIEWKGGAKLFDVPSPVPEGRTVNFIIDNISAGLHPFVVYMQDMSGNTSRPAGVAGLVYDTSGYEAFVASIPDSNFAPENIELTDPVMSNAMVFNDAPWILWGTTMGSSEETHGRVFFKFQDKSGAWVVKSYDSSIVNGSWWHELNDGDVLIDPNNRTDDSLIRHDTADRIGFYWWMEYDVDCEGTADLGDSFMDEFRYQTRTLHGVKLDEHINDW